MDRLWSDYERMESELSVFNSHLQHILHFGMAQVTHTHTHLTPRRRDCVECVSHVSQEQIQAQRQLWMMEDILCGLRVNKNRFMSLLGLQTHGGGQMCSNTSTCLFQCVYTFIIFSLFVFSSSSSSSSAKNPLLLWWRVQRSRHGKQTTDSNCHSHRLLCFTTWWQWSLFLNSCVTGLCDSTRAAAGLHDISSELYQKLWTWHRDAHRIPSRAAATDTRGHIDPSDVTNGRTHLSRRPGTNPPAVGSEEQQDPQKTQQNDAWDHWQDQTLPLGGSARGERESQQTEGVYRSGWWEGLDRSSSAGTVKSDSISFSSKWEIHRNKQADETEHLYMQKSNYLQCNILQDLYCMLLMNGGQWWKNLSGSIMKFCWS